MSRNFLGYVNDVDDQIKSSLKALNVSGLDDQLHNILSELPIFIHADFFSWFLNFLDSELIDAPITRVFLDTWRSQPRTSILSLVKFVHLLQQEAPQPQLALQIASYARLNYSDVLGHLCLSGYNFGDMLAKFQRYHSLMFEGLNVQIKIDHQHVLVKCSLPIKLKEVLRSRRIVATVIEICLAGIFTVIRRSFDSNQPLYNQVLIPSLEPENAEMYGQFFECPVIFNADHLTVKLDITLMSQPLDLSIELLAVLIKKRIQSEMGLLSAMLSDPFLNELQDHIFRALENRSPNIDYVAEKMAISRASLQRRLSERDISFSEQLDKTRLNLAKLYLEHKKLSLSEIAWLLGFSDQTAFSRSFKRWLGMSPLDFRRLF